MAFYPKRKQSDFVPAPEGLHRCVCVDVVDLGLIKVSYQGNESIKDMLRLVWQTEELMSNSKPYIITKRYTNSTHKKASLRIHCEAWRGKQFTDEEFCQFDLETLIGKNCQIQIAHNVSDGSTYANIQSIVQAPKGLRPLVPDGYVRVKDRPGYRAPQRPHDTESMSASDDWQMSDDQPQQENQDEEDIPF